MFPCDTDHFYWSNAGRWSSRCKGCAKRATNERWSRLKSDPDEAEKYTRAKAKKRETNLVTYSRNIALVDGVKESSVCAVCGESRAHALQFHHRRGEQKLFNICQARTSGRSEELILAEIAKCDILCANCHIDAHHSERQEAHSLSANN